MNCRYCLVLTPIAADMYRDLNNSTAGGGINHVSKTS